MTVAPMLDRWISTPRPNPAARLRLFCFPYAGGGPAIFRGWPQELPSGVEVCAVQPPGRGPRIAEPPFARLAPLVEAVAEALAPHLDRPFAFFGHSLGALVGYELALHLRRARGPQPAHLFVSGRRAPQIPDSMSPTHTLPDEEFIAELRRLNGTPPALLEHEELMKLMLPALRADFAVCQTYRHGPGPRLDLPITAWGGAEDPDISRGHLDAWREVTSGPFSSAILPGDHFFLQASQALLLRALAGELGRHLRPPAAG